MTVEKGNIPSRIEFVRESTIGEFNSNPSWEKYSDNVQNITVGSDPNAFAREAIGTPDTQGFNRGPDEQTVTIEYYLQRWLVDGSGNANDAAYDGIARNSDNQLPNTHTMVSRADYANGGADSGGQRIYVVGRGGHVGTVTITGNVGEGEPIPVTLDYQFKKVRIYTIDQPSSSTKLVVSSDDSSDTTQSVTVEDEDSDTSDSLTLDGTNLVSTSSSYSDIDAVEIDSDTVGDITLAINDGTEASPTEGTALLVIEGSGSYSDVEGDLGVPALGTGSHASDVGTAYEHFLDDTVERPSGTDLTSQLVSHELTVDNDLDVTPVNGTLQQHIESQKRTAEMDSTVFEEAGREKFLKQLLTGSTNNVRWTLSGGNFQIPTARAMSQGDLEKDPNAGTIQIDTTYEGQGITIDA